MAEIREQVQAALKAWAGANIAAPALGDLLGVRLQRQRDNSAPHEAVNSLLADAVDAVALKRPDVAMLLRMVYREGALVQTVANRIGFSESTYYRRRQEAITLLTAQIQQMENNALQARLEEVTTSLNLPNTDILVGLDAPLAALRELVRGEQTHWVTAIEGIGGIGKTALAATLMRTLLDDPELAGFAWVSAYRGVASPLARMRLANGRDYSSADLLESLIRQLAGGDAVPLPFSVDAGNVVLRGILKQAPYLIVVDNLETTTDLDTLLPIIHSLADPTRFVLTSRQSVATDPTVARLAAVELTQRDVYHLIRLLGEYANLPQVAALTDEELQPVYGTVGGNPLALRLLVGQMHTYPLDVVLRSMQEAHGARTLELYDYIFQRSWAALDEVAQRLLVAMAMTPGNGATFTTLQAMSDLSPGVAMDAISALQSANLLDHQPVSASESVYSIHSLTRTFLLGRAGRLR